MSDAHAFHRRAVAAARSAPDVTTIRLAPGGVPVTAHLAGAALTAVLAPSLLADPVADAEPAAVLHAFDTAGSGVPIPAPPWRGDDYLRRDEIRGLTAGDLLGAFDVAHTTLCLYDAVSATGVLWARDAAGMAPWEPGSPLRNLLRWALAPHGRYLLHAAAVGTPAGRGVLLCGPGGAGKSTTALAFLAAGLPFVADDYCLVRTDRPRAYPLYGVAKADATTLRLVDGLTDRADRARQDWRGKWRLPIADRVAAQLDLDAVVLPRVAERTGRLRPLPARDALTRILPSTLFQLPAASAVTLAALTALLEQLPVFELEVGPDVTAIPDRIDAGLTDRIAA